MKAMIKQYYHIPEFEKMPLKMMISQHQNKASLLRILPYLIIMAALAMFIQYYISINLSYIDITLSNLQVLPATWVMVSNVIIFLGIFIYEHLLILLTYVLVFHMVMMYNVLRLKMKLVL